MVKQIYAVGMSVHSSQLATRERLQQVYNTLPNILRFCKAHRLESLLPIFTCNRAEWVVISDDITPFKTWLETVIPAQELYVYEGVEAIEHILKVACGLDAMVRGESEVLGQLKLAIAQAQEKKTLSELGYSLMLDIVNKSKTIRSMSLLDSKPYSIVQTLRFCLEKVFTNMRERNVVLVGAGEMNQVCARRLHGMGFQNLKVVNRSLNKAQELAASIGASADALVKLPQILQQADCLLVATSAPHAILEACDVAGRSLERPLMIFDLSVPRNVAMEVRDMPGVYLFDMDDLNKIHQQVRDQRDDAINMALCLTESGAYELYQTFVLRLHAHVVASFRKHLSDIKDEVVAGAEQKIDKGADPTEVVKRALNELLNKALHKPTVLLRQAIKRQEYDVVKTIDELMGVEE